jgi:hypothetical protein
MPSVPEGSRRQFVAGSRSDMALSLLLTSDHPTVEISSCWQVGRCHDDEACAPGCVASV